MVSSTIFSVALIFLSTLSLRRATVYLASQTFDIDISIHALLAESDFISLPSNLLIRIFLSTLSLRRATAIVGVLSRAHKKFLSTLSLRRATFSLLCRILFRRYFYPRSPCGERLRMNWLRTAGVEFLSTLSLRRATTSALFNPLLW